MRFFTLRCRALLLTAVLAVGAACLSGCGGNKDGSAGSEKSGQGSSPKKAGTLTDSRDGPKYRPLPDPSRFVVNGYRLKCPSSSSSCIRT